MDVPGSKTPARHRHSLSTERLLGAFHHAPPESTASTSSAAAAGELHEDDLFWSGDSAAESPRSRNGAAPSSPSSLAVVSRLSSHSSRIRSFAQPEGFGILAALPEDEASPSLRRDQNSFFHKASVSSSSSSSPSSASRLIPIAPKAPQDRITPISSVKYHQSAPVNVPILSAATRRPPRDFFGEDDGDGAEADDGETEMLPPHEMVARSLAQSPRLSCSVLEGAGRTLKGRDLRRVRNAVFRQTGFLD